MKSGRELAKESKDLIKERKYMKVIVLSHKRVETKLAEKKKADHI